MTNKQYLKAVRDLDSLEQRAQFDESLAGEVVELRKRIDDDSEPCPGDAHAPEVGGMQDNCLICAPRWGFVQKRQTAGV